MTSREAPSEEWLQDFKKRLRALVLRADYRAGYRIARQALAKWPDEFDIRYQYAKLLGDWADEFPAKKRAKAKREAIRILKPLTRALSGKGPETRFGLCLNYYYQAQDYRGMCRYGRKLIARKERSGFYALGLGASYLAFANHQRGKTGSARSWARTGVRAWSRYGLQKETYYFPHYVNALALALSSEPKLALLSLKRAARLSGKKLEDWEFRDVLALIGAMER